MGVTRDPGICLATGVFVTVSVSVLMTNNENPKNYSTMTVPDIAELLGVTDRQVRNWIRDKGLPAKSDPRGYTLDWHVTLRWFVTYRMSETSGTRGNRRTPTGSDLPEVPEESYEDALARKTRAEADIKELQLARERSQVASIADVERILTNANKSIQTLILALPTRLATQVQGIEDRVRLVTIIDRECRALLSNLANIDAITETQPFNPEEDE